MIRIRRRCAGHYLTGAFQQPLDVRGVRRLGGPDGDTVDPRSFGYGVPLEIECTVGGAPEALVMARTRVAQGFGHDYPADRAWQAGPRSRAGVRLRRRSVPGAIAAALCGRRHDRHRMTRRRR